jgi:hypothetical protein
MNLSDTLTEIADFLALDADQLRAYADEDTLGGFHSEPSQATFPGGSLWGVEGQVLYALVRALKPREALELGTWHGASTTHLLTALKANVIPTLLDSVDVWEGAGSLVPHSLQYGWYMHYQEAVAFLKTFKGRRRLYSLAYEDCIHSEPEVYAIVTALKPKLSKGAVVVHHDSEHGDDGLKIKRGLERAGVDYRSWLIEPSDCGLAIWVNR